MTVYCLNGILHRYKNIRAERWPAFVKSLNLQFYNPYMSLIVRKPVFGISDLVRHKPGCAATEDG